MNESAPLIVAIIGTLIIWTTTVASLSLWLASRFRSLEKLIYHEQNKLDQKYMALFKDHSDRIMVLELKRNGVTKSDRY